MGVNVRGCVKEISWIEDNYLIKDGVDNTRITGGWVFGQPYGTDTSQNDANWFYMAINKVDFSKYTRVYIDYKLDKVGNGDSHFDAQYANGMSHGTVLSWNPKVGSNTSINGMLYYSSQPSISRMTRYSDISSIISSLNFALYPHSNGATEKVYEFLSDSLHLRAVYSSYGGYDAYIYNLWFE